MSCLSQRSASLLLCGAIFLFVPSCTRAIANFKEIRGTYSVERRSLTTCRCSAEVRNIRNFLPPNGFSFGGVKCRFDGLGFRKVYGMNGLDRARNDSVGTIILGISTKWTCHDSTRRLVGLVFLPPKFRRRFLHTWIQNSFPFPKECPLPCLRGT